MKSPDIKALKIQLEAFGGKINKKKAAAVTLFLSMQACAMPAMNTKDPDFWTIIVPGAICITAAVGLPVYGIVSRIRAKLNERDPREIIPGSEEAPVPVPVVQKKPQDQPVVTHELSPRDIRHLNRRNIEISHQMEIMEQQGTHNGVYADYYRTLKNELEKNQRMIVEKRFIA